MAPHSKRRSRAYSQTWCSSFSPKPLSAVALASDRSIAETRHWAESNSKRYASLLRRRLPISEGNASQGCSCRCVRNSSLTSTEVRAAGSASAHIAFHATPSVGWVYRPEPVSIRCRAGTVSCDTPERLLSCWMALRSLMP